MSEHVPLGAGDAEPRWAGVRRHQALLAMAGVSLAGDWLLGRHHSSWELAAGVVAGLSAVPVLHGTTLGEAWVIAVAYALRSRWITVHVETREDSLVVRARGQARVAGYRLQQRGRLDLAGRDLGDARMTRGLVDALATGETARHLSWHVRCDRDEASTLLCVDGEVSAPDGWRRDDGLVADVVGVVLADATWLLERWGYVRGPREVASVLRVRDFTAVPADLALLEKLQGASRSATVALHCEIVASERARRVAERAVHRQRSDGAVASAVGFRTTARTQRALERLSQREALVVSGRALMRVGVYVVVRASALDDLRAEVRAVQRRAHEAGVQLERGLGRQGVWYCWQLPGGPGW